MNFDPSPIRRHELGLFLPPSVEPDAAPPPLPHMGTYLTYSELTEREPMPESEIIARVETMSAADCLLALAQIGTRMFAGGNRGIEGDVQHELVDQVVGDGALGQVLHEKLADPRWSAIFCEQQLVHLARLVILHADRRAPDEFDNTKLYAEWVTCLIAVTDMLDAGLNVEDRDERLAWEIRQCQLNHHPEQLPATAMHYELYSVRWPEMLPEGATARHRPERSCRPTYGRSVRGHQ